MPDIQLDHLNLPARDAQALAQWYARTFALEAGKNVVRGPGVLITFQQAEPVNRSADELHIGFRVPSLEALKQWAKKFDAELKTGAEFTSFRTTDPEGNGIELYTPNR